MNERYSVLPRIETGLFIKGFTFIKGNWSKNRGTGLTSYHDKEALFSIA
jgi:hypothetical protein